MPRSSGDPPKYLMCARALALLSGLAGGATGCGSSVTGNDGAPGQTDGGGDADSAAGFYDGGVQGVRVMPDASPQYTDAFFPGVRVMNSGCAVGGTGEPPSAPIVAGLAGAGLIARRRRRRGRDVP